MGTKVDHVWVLVIIPASIAGKIVVIYDNEGGTIREMAGEFFIDSLIAQEQAMLKKLRDDAGVRLQYLISNDNLRSTSLIELQMKICQVWHGGIDPFSPEKDVSSTTWCPQNL